MIQNDLAAISNLIVTLLQTLSPKPSHPKPKQEHSCESQPKTRTQKTKSLRSSFKGLELRVPGLEARFRNQERWHVLLFLPLDPKP